jgi:hypothetical protein
MTRESRLQDVVSCGSIRGLNLDFDREKIKEIEINGEKKSSGFFVLREKFDECMKLKGYSIFPQCDERCLDP